MFHSLSLCAFNGDILRAAAVEGLGVTLLPTFIIGHDLQAGRLRQVLAEYCPTHIDSRGFPVAALSVSQGAQLC